MGKHANSIQAHRIAPGSANGASQRPPDYLDAFEVTRSATDSRSAEQWFRAVFENAPRPVRWFLLIGWQWVLLLRLGPRASPDHVLGWRIASNEAGTVRLEVESPLMAPQLLLCVADSTATWTTNVSYQHKAAKPLWAVVGPIHRQIIPYCLARAASISQPARAERPVRQSGRRTGSRRSETR